MSSLQRPPKSAAEIDALPPLGTTQCVAYLREHAPAFAPETLVYVMREALRLQDTPLFEMCANVLFGRPGANGRWEGGHCEPTIAKMARSYGLYEDLELRCAFRARCLALLVRAIHAGRDRKAYWEERFGDAFKKVCVDARRSLRSRQTRDMEAGVTDARYDDDELDSEPDPATVSSEDTIISRVASSHRRTELLAAVRDLPPRQARAVFLHYFEERTVEGQGPDSAASIMGISDRAVRLLLAKARATLSANPRLQGLWPIDG